MRPKSQRTIKKRKTAKEREDEIISAAIAVIGTKGLSQTTLADIAQKAGVGYGNLTFRFNSKDKLLTAALRAVLDEYTEIMTAAAAADIPAEPRLRRLISAAFAPSVTTRAKVALWNAFLSECHTRVAYRKIFAELRQNESDRTLSICKEIIEGRKRTDLDANTIALGINALIEGLWLNMRLGRVTDRKTALNAAIDCVELMIGIDKKMISYV